MPQAAQKLCTICKRVGEGCTCKRAAQREYDKRRGTREERGYDWTWRKFSERYREENPLCEKCLASGRVTPSEHVHHEQKLADHPELKYEPDNLAALCERCHAEITAKGG